MALTDVLTNLALVVAAAGIWLFVAHRSIQRPEMAIWPPRSGSLITAVWAWGVTVLLYVGCFGLGTSDWNPHGISPVIRWGFGGLLAVISTVLHVKSMADLGLSGVIGGQFLDHRRQLATGATPLGPKIDQNWLI